MTATRTYRRSPRLDLLSAVLALFIAVILLVVHQYFVGSSVMREELGAQAAIIAENSGAALVFDDARAGRETIATIRHTPRIVAGALYRLDGSALAAEADDHALLPERLSTDHAGVAADGAGPFDNLILHPVRVEGVDVGTLLLRVDFSSLYWRLLEYMIGAISIAVVALALAYRLTRRLRQRMVRTEEQLQQYALYDQITSLPNRRLFEQELRKAISRVERTGQAAALLFVDVDDFKKVNDSFGHEVGDRVLASVGDRLRGAVRDDDVVARIGGDEFAVILKDVGNPDDAAHVAGKLIEAIGAPFTTEPTPTYIGLCVGIAMIPADGQDPAQLLRRADMAMYVAKAQGKNAFQFFSEVIDGKVRHDLLLETCLRRALAPEAEELWVAYQPKLCARTGRVVGVEALARWQEPDRGPISPAEFIPVAEHTGLIVALGDRVLELVCRDLARLRLEGVELPQVAVNVSPRQLQGQGDVVERFCRTLTHYGEPAGRFEFELTESALTDTRGATVLEAFREAGFALAIDDFGTGYSSLGYLKRFQVRTLKVDQSFVRGLPADESSAAIARAVVDMAHALNIDVVAEGVETEAQAAFLARCGCDILQGYLLGRPMPVAELADYLHRHVAARHAHSPG